MENPKEKEYFWLLSRKDGLFLIMRTVSTAPSAAAAVLQKNPFCRKAIVMDGGEACLRGESL